MIYSPPALPSGCAVGQRTSGINHITPRFRPITLTYYIDLIGQSSRDVIGRLSVNMSSAVMSLAMKALNVIGAFRSVHCHS